jgi:hypothetical protein
VCYQALFEAHYKARYEARFETRAKIAWARLGRVMRLILRCVMPRILRRLGWQTWPADLAGRLVRQTWPADMASRLGLQTWPVRLVKIKDGLKIESQHCFI